MPEPPSFVLATLKLICYQSNTRLAINMSAIFLLIKTFDDTQKTF